MQTLTDERWNEIRWNLTDPSIRFDLRQALNQVLQQHDHIAAQIKLLADYIMNERPDDPLWPQQAGACVMAVEIMKRERDEIEELDSYITDLKSHL